MRPRCLHRMLTLMPLMLAALLAPFASRAQTAKTNQAPMLDSATSAVSLPDRLISAITTTLEKQLPADPAGSAYAVTSGHIAGNWALVSIVSLNSPDADNRYVGRGDSGKLTLATQSVDGTWQAELKGSAAFDRLLQSAPGYLIDSTAKQILATSSVRAQSTPVVNYKFPWPAGISWNWWASWHPDPKNDGHDFGTTGPDLRVLASAAGTITYVCRGAYSVSFMIRHADGVTLFYVHIDKNTVNPKLREGVTVRQGQVLGRLKPGTWNDGTCGYTVQSSNAAHLHWMLPTDRAFTVDGWTIKYPDNYWERAGEKKIPAFSATSSAMVSTNKPYDPSEVWMPLVGQ